MSVTMPLCAIGDRCRGHDPATGQPLPPRDVHDRGFICVTCRHRLQHALTELPDLYDALNEALIPGRGATGTRHIHNPWPANPAVIGLAGHVYGVLASWAMLVVETRGLTPPRATPGDIRALTGWLSNHVEWIAHRDWAADAWTEITDLRRAAYTAAYPDRDRKIFPLPRHRRQCPDCGGTLHAHIHSRRHNDTLIRCDTCGREWTPTEWFRLGRRILQST